MSVTVEEYTSPNLITISYDVSVAQAHSLMLENEIRHLPVTNGTKLVGVVSMRDTLTHLGKSWETSICVADIMNTEIFTVHKNDNLSDVAFKLSEFKLGSAIVLDDDGIIYGIFTTTDALNALVEIYDPRAREKSGLQDLDAN